MCRGQDVTLECHSEAFPKSINFWVNNKGAMLVSSIHHDDNDQLTIPPMMIVMFLVPWKNKGIRNKIYLNIIIFLIVFVQIPNMRR